MISLPERSRVWVLGSSAWGAAGSGICFTHTTTFITGHCSLPGPTAAIRRAGGLSPAGRHRQRGPEAVGDDRVDAGVEHGRQLGILVRGPHVHQDASLVAPVDQLLVDPGELGMDGLVAAVE